MHQSALMQCTLLAGTIVHIAGIPMKVGCDTTVYVEPSNFKLIQGKSSGVREGGVKVPEMPPPNAVAGEGAQGANPAAGAEEPTTEEPPAEADEPPAEQGKGKKGKR